MTAAPEMAGKEPRRRMGGFRRSAMRVLAAASLAGAFLWQEGRRTDSILPRWDEALLAAMQHFLPGDGPAPLVLESVPDKDTRVFAPAAKPEGLPVDLACFGKDEATTLSAWPPGPLDYAVVLNALEKSGAKGIALAPTSWTGRADGTLAGRAFGHTREALGRIPLVAGYEPGMSAAPPDDAAAGFARLPFIPTAQVHGDLNQVPEVNDPGPLPPGGTGVDPADLGFSRLLVSDIPTGFPGRLAVPMVARAGVRLLPSQALLLLARASGADLASAEVRLGKAILLGDLAVPIDNRGCLQLPVTHLRRIGRVAALDLARPDGTAAEEQTRAFKDRYVVVGYDGLPKAVAGAGGEVTTAEWTAAAIGAMAARDFGQPIRVLRRAPEGNVLAICVLFMAGAILVLPLQRSQRVGAALVMAGLYGLATRQALVSPGVFHGMVLPLGVCAAAFGTALCQSARYCFLDTGKRSKGRFKLWS